MMRQTCGLALLLGVILNTALACSIEPSDQRRGSGDQPTDEDLEKANDGNATVGLSSKEAFAQTVYKRVREENCLNCHESNSTPYFAASDLDEAHKAIISAQKVDLDNPVASRLVLRLGEDEHNCWSADCADDAAKMLADIIAWKKMMATDDGAGDTGQSTTSLTLSDAIEKEVDAGDLRTIFTEAEAGNFTAPMVAVNNNGASGGQVAFVPTGNGGLLQANDPTAGVATYQVDIQQAGTYRFWGRVSTANVNENSFYLRVDGGTPLIWRTSLTNGSLEWDLASDQDVDGNIHQFQLSAGLHDIEIRQREDGTRLDAFVLTSDATFTGGSGGSAGAVQVLRYDLSDLVGEPDVFFDIEIVAFDEFSYKLKNPSIITKRSGLVVEGIKILMNDEFDPQHSTYMKIKETVATPGGVLSTAALIMPSRAGVGKDDISISFSKLKFK